MAEPADNGGLVADCAALLGLKRELAGDAVLNWSEQLPLAEWEGVSTGGAEDAPARVTELQLDGRGLTGGILAALGVLDDLRELRLDNNRLAGEIPAALGALTNLRELGLADYGLTGEAPAALDRLVNLRRVRLAGDSNGSG